MKKTRVMVIDDEEDFLRVVKLNLAETDKYEVVTSPSLKNIISQVHSFKPDIILLDLLMPTIGGLEGCEMLNNDPLGRGVPIIILSALDKNTDKLKAYRLGVVDYLVKPIEKNDLIASIEKALQFKKPV